MLLALNSPNPEGETGQASVSCTHGYSGLATSRPENRGRPWRTENFRSPGLTIYWLADLTRLSDAPRLKGESDHSPKNGLNGKRNDPLTPRRIVHAPAKPVRNDNPRHLNHCGGPIERRLHRLSPLLEGVETKRQGQSHRLCNDSEAEGSKNYPAGTHKLKIRSTFSEWTFSNFVTGLTQGEQETDLTR